MRRNTKFVLGGAGGLVIIVTIAVTLVVVLSDPDPGLMEDKSVEEILREIRESMRDADIVGTPIQAYIIPSVDAHQSEYISGRDKRIAYVSSFTGSAGTVVITPEAALLWTDSRYHIQAKEQIDPEYWTLMESGNPGVPTYIDWLLQQSNIEIVGIDPLLMDSTSFESLSARLISSGKSLKSISTNLVDKTWTTKPALELSVIIPLPMQFSGKNVSEKLADVRRDLKTLGVQSHMVTALDDVAWLLNLRGLDIPYNPVFFAYVIISETEVLLYVLNTDRITPAIQEHFETEGIAGQIKIFEYDSAIDGLVDFVEKSTGVILLSRPNQAIFESVPPAKRRSGTSPIVLLKTVKNAIEANGMRNAHIRDAAAIIQYIHWLNETIDSRVITELSGASQLGEFREALDNFRGLSFTAISAVGSNAAMAHYSPTTETDRQITRDDVYLIDSGGQYFDGTTDTTRTVHFGQPKDSEKDAFTRVLKGFISMGSSTFPVRAPFSFFDAMARRALWDVGLNYGHGTGHGIGMYMNVHEYPPLISSSNSDPGMLENMFTSNEPGYYEEGQFGIRIEDVIQAVPARAGLGNFNGVGALQFYHVTVVPIQVSLIKVELLTRQEVAWLNEYHQRVYDSTEGLLTRLGNTAARTWLYDQTRPISYMP